MQVGARIYHDSKNVAETKALVQHEEDQKMQAAHMVVDTEKMLIRLEEQLRIEEKQLGDMQHKIEHLRNELKELEAEHQSKKEKTDAISADIAKETENLQQFRVAVHVHEKNAILGMQALAVKETTMQESKTRLNPLNHPVVHRFFGK